LINRLPPAAVHATPTAAPAMATMTMPPPAHRRCGALICGSDTRQRRDRGGLRRPRHSHGEQACDSHRKDSPCHFHSPCFSSGANLCQRITRDNRGGSADDTDFTLMNEWSESFCRRFREARCDIVQSVTNHFATFETNR
jgi:hypothetical protein